MKEPKKNVLYYDTLVGTIGIADNGKEITNLFYTLSDKTVLGEERETPLIKKTIKQLREFLSGKRKEFDLPLAPHGTEFQKNVWNALQKVPYGETRSYKQIAEMIDNPEACRAVGGANNRNPIAIIIPCHRIIGVNGKLVGYAGGIDKKQKLLEIEKAFDVTKK